MDKDLMILRWLAREPAGTASRRDIQLASDDDLLELKRRGFITEFKLGESSGTYVITAEGRRLSEGD